MDVKNCFGCSACAQICPQQCIRMIPDVEGFGYPSVDESACIKCGLCYEVCPSLKDTLFETAESQKFYAFVYKDRNIVEQSSSGGAFTAIAEAFCNVGSYKIFGAKWNDDFSVSHSSIDDVSDIDIFRKSKYLQSEIGNSYIEVENALKDGQTVVFSGTPCQVAGLKSFLKKDYDRLLLLDIICHGVPSKLIFQQYIKSLEKKSQSYMSQYIFRFRKSLFGIIDPYASRAVFANDKTVDLFSYENEYLKSFFIALNYRLSCYNCPYSRKQRVSDITIGDFWGIEKYDKKYNATKGVSLIISNTRKGENLLLFLNDGHTIEQVPEKFALENNRNLKTPSKMHSRRKEYINHILHEDFIEVTKNYIPKISKIKFFAANSPMGKFVKAVINRKDKHEDINDYMS